MSNTIFDQMLSRYEVKTNDDYTNALHEVMQQTALAGLYRGGFFNKAALRYMPSHLLWLATFFGRYGFFAIAA